MLVPCSMNMISPLWWQQKREEELEIQKKLSEAQAQEERVLMKDLSSNKKRPDPFDESPESAQSDAPLTDYVLSIKFVKKLLE